MRLHLKVPGRFSDLNALLTRKLPMLLTRLNEVMVVEEIFVLKFLKMAFLIARFCWW